MRNGFINKCGIGRTGKFLCIKISVALSQWNFNWDGKIYLYDPHPEVYLY